MFPTEAYILQSQLESEGIASVLGDEYTVSAHPFLSNAIGGVKLKIKESDATKALEIVRHNEQAFKKDRTEVKESYSNGFVEQDTYCKNCESRNVFRKKLPLLLTLLLIIFPYTFLFWFS